MIKISKHIPISYIQEVSFPMIEIHSSVEIERTCLLIDLLKPTLALRKITDCTKY